MSPDGSVKPPPEEKLLKLIRGKPARPAAEAASAAPAVSVETAVVGPVGKRPRLGRLPWTRWAVAVFGTLLGLEAVCLLAQIIWPLGAIDIPRPSAAPAGGEVQAAPAPEELPSLAASVSRPVFSPVSAGPSASAFSPPSGSAKLLASRLTLMGIVAGEPAQAIIADSQTNKTYFVTAGQAVVEGAVLEQVLENGVVLDLGGEKIELAL